MLESLHIRNYRSCLDTTIEFQPDLTVLIGPNGSGKTNVLNACQLLRKLAEDEVSPSFFRKRDNHFTDLSDLTCAFRVGGHPLRLYSTVEVATDENNSDNVVSAKNLWYSSDLTGTRKRYELPFARTPGTKIRYEHDLRYRALKKLEIAYEIHGTAVDELFKTITTVSEYLLDLKYYSASRFTDPSKCPVSFEIEKSGSQTRGVRLRGHGVFLNDLYQEFTNRKVSNYDTFFQIIGPEGLKLVDKIDFKSISISSIDYSVRTGARVRRETKEKILVIPQFTIGRNRLSPNQLSEGTFKTITLLFYLLTERSSGLLIEEPEVYVHHGLLASIIELILSVSKTKQIVLSTHSDFILDHLETRHVYLVTRTGKRNNTKVEKISQALSKNDYAALKSYLAVDGNLGEYWRHGGFV